MPAPAVTTDDHFLACPQQVESVGNAVHAAPAGAVAVIEKILGMGVVDSNNEALVRSTTLRNLTCCATLTG